MNHIAPIHESAIRSVALDRLFIAPENVRKTPPDAVAEAEMKASIATHGLLENLVARSDGPDGDYAVVAGGRRLAALKALAADGVLDACHPVPCLIRNAASAELSLAENVIRIAMHPADQVIAFTKLAESGVTVAAIAARFGMSERLVEQRLRLGNAAPELLDAYRTDNIGLETLKAFAVTTDHSRQMAVWEQLANQGYRPAPSQVKRLLTEERIPANSAMARFVGVDAYEDAGGPVLRDLFATEDEDGIWFEAPALLNELAMAKLGETVKDLATRWHWAMAMQEIDWTEVARYGRIHPEPATPTDEETAELERLRTREDELTNLDEDDWTEALAEEAEAIETRTCEINLAIDARATYRAEDYAIAGSIATIGRNGELQVIQGLVRPEDMPKSADSGDSATGAPGDGDGDDATGAGRFQRPAISAPIASPADPQAEARKEAGVGIGLADDLCSIRTALVKAHLGNDFEAAFDLMLFQLGRAVFTRGYRAHALDIAIRETADRPTMRMNDKDFGAWSPGEAMLTDRSNLRLDWLTIEDDGESFAALRALPEADKQALFAATVARTVSLPTVETVHGGIWSVRADVLDCPDLELLLPARKEAVENAFLAEMRQAARLAIYRAMAADPDPRPAFVDWTQARDAGIYLTPPPQILRPWRPGIADIDDWREPLKLAPAGHDALVMACDPEPPEAQALWRAAERAGMADRLFEADKRLEGYGWYDGLDRVTGIDTEVAAHGKTWPLHDFPVPEGTGAPAAPLATRPSVIRMALAVKPASGPSRTLDLPADLAFVGEAWSWVGEALPLVTADSTLEPHRLAELLRHAFFTPSDDIDADSRETQAMRFDEEALHIATRLLCNEDSALALSIAETIRRELFWLVPHHRTVEISITRPDVRVTLGDPGETAT